MRPRHHLLCLFLGTLSLLSAGCITSDANTTTLHYQQTQCEPFPWGAGDDADAIAAHYGTSVTAAKEVDDGFAYAAVCGGPSSRHIEVTVRGDAAAMRADGWRDGPVPQA